MKRFPVGSLKISASEITVTASEGHFGGSSIVPQSHRERPHQTMITIIFSTISPQCQMSMKRFPVWLPKIPSFFFIYISAVNTGALRNYQLCFAFGWRAYKLVVVDSKTEAKCLQCLFVTLTLRHCWKERILWFGYTVIVKLLTPLLS